MHGHNIKVYARLKNDSNSKEKVCDILRKHDSYEDIFFYRDLKGENHGLSKFRFNLIFDDTKDQKAIFYTVAEPVVTRVLQGFNATIFAYGQTGSGKTYTMTGSTKKYEERGIIPRSLQHIFSKIEKSEEKPTLYISYMEIYNEICYDLLSPRENKTALILEELPRVVVLEDKKGQARLKNLSVLPVSTEEEAMRLLFLGDTNRAIAETPLNEYSSRSHCIFTIYIMAKSHDNQSMIYSKLNLVDLAGSERVHKSCITGNILNEAKHINLSLHFLQQVILALSETKRTHIPYRNSILTFILKDSLGGNCLTVMLATLALSANHIQESISTCKFAQRVALIKTLPIINEVSDPHQEILLLKNEIQQLRKQLANVKPTLSVEETVILSSKQKEDIEIKLEKYLKSNEDTKPPEIDPGLYQYCFQLFKNKIKTLENKLEDVNNKAPSAQICDNDKRGLDGVELVQCQNSEADDYLNLLSQTYERAKSVAAIIEECQVNISYLREKLDAVAGTGNTQQKFLLAQELNHQQRIYRKNLLQLKTLKTQTLQLETGLAKAKAKLMQCSNHQLERKHSVQKLKDLGGIYEDTACNFAASDYLQAINFTEYNSCGTSWSQEKNAYTENTSDKLPPLNNVTNHNIEKTFNNCCNCNQHTHNCCCDCMEDNSTCHIKCFESADLLCHQNNHFCFSSSSGNNYLGYENQNQFNECLLYNHNNPVEQPVNSCPYVIGHYNERTIYNPNIEVKKRNQNTCCLRNNKDDNEALKCQVSNHSTNIQSNINHGKSDRCCFTKINDCQPIRKLKTTAYKNSQITEHLELENLQTIDKRSKNLLECTVENRLLNSEVQVIPDKLCKFVRVINDVNQNLSKNKEMCESPSLSSTSAYNQEVKKTELPTTNNNETYEIFLDTDNENFKNFINTIPLTGNEDIDKEICNFYRSKIGN